MKINELCVHKTSDLNPGFATTVDFSFDDYARLTKILATKTMPSIDKVIFQKDHTIVIWADDTRTVVKCSEEDFDKEKGLAMAICKKYTSRGEFKRLIEEADIQDK